MCVCVRSVSAQAINACCNETHLGMHLISLKVERHISNQTPFKCRLSQRTGTRRVALFGTFLNGVLSFTRQILKSRRMLHTRMLLPPLHPGSGASLECLGPPPWLQPLSRHWPDSGLDARRKSIIPLVTRFPRLDPNITVSI